MFNETSFPGCGLGDAANIQRRVDAGKRVKQSKIDKFGIVLPPGYTTLPLPKVPKAPIALPPAGGGVLIDPLVQYDPAAGAATDSAADDSGFGFDLSSITDMVSGVPWYLWAAAAYLLFFRKRR